MSELRKIGAIKITLAVIIIVMVGISGTVYSQSSLLNNQFALLQASYHDLQTLYTALQNQMSTLLLSYSSLQLDHDTLVSKYNSVLRNLTATPTLSTTNFGWTGYIETTGEVAPLLDRLEASGWDTVRYQAIPAWALGHHVGYVTLLNLTVLDLLVDEASKRNMTVYLLCAHCWAGNDYGATTGGSGNFIDGYEQEWINLWLTLGTRYKGKNIVIDAWSEYSSVNGTTRYKALAQSLIDALRNAGIEAPVHFNIWWNSPIFALNDSSNNYSVGRHQYGAKFDDYYPNYNSTTLIDFETVCEESGINANISHYFVESNNAFYQEATRLGMKYVISEMGGSNTPDASYGGKYSMSVGNVAYAMKLLQVAKAYNVTCIMHRIGVYDDYYLYYYYAQKYFGKNFWDAS